MDDEEIVCLECFISSEHKSHKIVKIEEAVEFYNRDFIIKEKEIEESLFQVKKKQIKIDEEFQKLKKEYEEKSIEFEEEKKKIQIDSEKLGIYLRFWRQFKRKIRFWKFFCYYNSNIDFIF